MVSTNHTMQGISKNNNPKDATIPIPQALKIVFLIFFCLENCSLGMLVFVNRNNELIAKRAKNTIANVK